MRPGQLDTLAATARTAARAILDRRTDRLVDDPDVEQFPEVTDLGGVVDYVHRYRRVGPEVLAADAVNVLTIIRYLRWHLDGRQHAAMRSARGLAVPYRVPWRRMADALGLRSPQAAEQAWLRLVGVFGDAGQRSELAGRAAQRAAGPGRRRASPAGQSARAVARGPVGELAEVARGLVAMVARVPVDLVDDVEDVRAGLDRWHARPGPLPDDLLADLALLASQRRRPDLDDEARHALGRVAGLVEQVRAGR